MADDKRSPSGSEALGSKRSEQELLSALSRTARGPATDDPDTLAEMSHNRRINSRLKKQGIATQMSFATGRPKDPMFYWQQNNLPYDVTKPEELNAIRAYCRIVYDTHPIVSSAIDVFSKFPVSDMELVCKDDALTEFYTDHFFGDSDLDYEEYFVDVGRQRWIDGEAWPFGSFNETLGVWEDDELLKPEDIEVRRSPFFKDPRFTMRLPESIRKVIEERQPPWEFKRLMEAYPELKHFVGENARMPVSGMLLHQVRFKTSAFRLRGTPLLLRAFRALMQEEMLNAAQDAVASRLYTPLILAKLGASASDLGTSQPWIPTQGDVLAFEEALDAALAADFRVLTHHFAIDIGAVLGREVVPNFNDDFDRLTDRLLQPFGMSRTMLTGAGRGETYAADAINFDLVSQLLTHHQRELRKLYKKRAVIVAEAQEHFDYDKRGDKRYVVMEEIYEIDPETREKRIVEQPKLLIPELRFKHMRLQSDQDQRQFVEALREQGVPISMKTRMVNIPIDLDEEIERARDETVKLAVEAQETRKATYEALRSASLPIPEDLRRDFEPKVVQAQEPVGDGQKAIPTLGLVETADDVALVPDARERAEIADSAQNPQSDVAPTVVRLPRNRLQQRTRPEQSDEQRGDMPKPAALDEKVMVTAQNTEGGIVRGRNGLPLQLEKTTEQLDEGEYHLITGPSHVGMRRYAGIDKDVPLDDQLGDD